MSELTLTLIIDRLTFQQMETILKDPEHLLPWGIWRACLTMQSVVSTLADETFS